MQDVRVVSRTSLICSLGLAFAVPAKGQDLTVPNPSFELPALSTQDGEILLDETPATAPVDLYARRLAADSISPVQVNPRSIPRVQNRVDSRLENRLPLPTTGGTVAYEASQEAIRLYFGNEP